MAEIKDGGAGRVIKFRAWSKDLKKMFHVSWLQFSRPWGGEVFEPSIGLLEGTIEHDGTVADHVLNQFTGLRDRNGREIYEGDLFKYEGREGKAIVGPVRWSETLGQWNVDDNLPLWALRKDAELCGNIYENPDLLSVRERRGK